MLSIRKSWSVSFMGGRVERVVLVEKHVVWHFSNHEGAEETIAWTCVTTLVRPEGLGGGRHHRVALTYWHVAHLHPCCVTASAILMAVWMSGPLGS